MLHLITTSASWFNLIERWFGDVFGSLIMRSRVSPDWTGEAMGNEGFSSVLRQSCGTSASPL